jgi:hypothetical protein
MNEGVFSLQIKKSILEQCLPSWCHKNLAGPYGAGLPDLEGIYKGRGFLFECKLVRVLPASPSAMMDYKFTPLQLFNLKAAAVAGGYAAGIICVEWRYAIFTCANNLKVMDINLYPRIDKISRDRWDMRILRDFGPLGIATPTI